MSDAAQEVIEAARDLDAVLGHVAIPFAGEEPRLRLRAALEALGKEEAPESG